MIDAQSRFRTMAEEDVAMRREIVAYRLANPNPELPGWVVTYDIPKRSFLARLKDAWCAAVDAWQYGFDEGNDE